MSSKKLTTISRCNNFLYHWLPMSTYWF